MPARRLLILIALLVSLAACSLTQSSQVEPVPGDEPDLSDPLDNEEPGDTDAIDGEIEPPVPGDAAVGIDEDDLDAAPPPVDNPPLGDGDGLGPISPDDPGGIAIFLVSDADGRGHTPIACEQFLAPRGTGISFPNNVTEEIELALGELFIESDPALTNFWAGTVLMGVSMSGGVLNVELSGGYVPTGVCADAAAQAQLLMILFNNPEVQEALVRVDGQNLKQMLDATGLVTADARYTRADLPVR